jgi:hypothetical protein
MALSTAVDRRKHRNKRDLLERDIIGPCIIGKAVLTSVCWRSHSGWWTVDGAGHASSLDVTNKYVECLLLLQKKSWTHTRESDFWLLLISCAKAEGAVLFPPVLTTTSYSITPICNHNIKAAVWTSRFFSFVLHYNGCCSFIRQSA